MAPSALWPVHTAAASHSCTNGDDTEVAAQITPSARPAIAGAGHRTRSDIPLTDLKAVRARNESDVATIACTDNESDTSTAVCTGGECIVAMAAPADDEDGASASPVAIQCLETARLPERWRARAVCADDVRADGVRMKALRTSGAHANDLHGHANDRPAAGSNGQTPQQPAIVSASAVETGAPRAGTVSVNAAGFALPMRPAAAMGAVDDDHRSAGSDRQTQRQPIVASTTAAGIGAPHVGIGNVNAARLAPPMRPAAATGAVAGIDCNSVARPDHRDDKAPATAPVATSAPPPPHRPSGITVPSPVPTASPINDTVLWACFQFPALPLHAVFAAEASGEHPCALYEGPRQRPVVVHANEAAQARGVRPGLVLATARALCAELDARKREPDAERSALQLLATWAYRFSAQISRGEPDTVWLEVGASLTLFNGWPALQRQLHAELQTLGFGAYRLGVAPIAAAARVLALSYEQIALRQHAAMRTALERTSIALSGLPAQSIAQLQGMGFRELRDLWRVPRLELTRRLGPAGMHTLAVLRGEAAESLTLYQPPDRFARRIELDALVDNWQPLLFPLRRLVNELARYLLVRDGGVQRFELRLEHEDRAATRVPVGLVSVQREAAALYEFCRGRLERTSIGAEVSAIALIADELPPFRPGHRDLFEPSRSEGLDWPALTERLRSRLGDEALQQLACVADHRPERAWRFVAPGTEIRDPAKTGRDAKPARSAKSGRAGQSRVDTAAKSAAATRAAPPTPASLFGLPSSPESSSGTSMPAAMPATAPAAPSSALSATPEPSPPSVTAAPSEQSSSSRASPEPPRSPSPPSSIPMQVPPPTQPSLPLSPTAGEISAASPASATVSAQGTSAIAPIPFALPASKPVAVIDALPLPIHRQVAEPSAIYRRHAESPRPSPARAVTPAPLVDTLHGHNDAPTVAPATDTAACAAERSAAASTVSATTETAGGTASASATASECSQSATASGIGAMPHLSAPCAASPEAGSLSKMPSPSLASSGAGHAPNTSPRPAAPLGAGHLPPGSSPPNAAPGPEPVPHARRPLWLLPQPVPLRQPLRQILSGPERIESGWWDGGDVRRDYYVVRCASGQRAWAFLPAGAAEGWMLHGWFA